MVSCLNLQLWSEQSATDCRIAPAFAAASFCGCSEVHLRVDPDFPSLRTCSCVPACTYGSLRLIAIDMHHLHIVFLCFSAVMPCGLVVYAFWSERSCMTSCSAQAYHYLFSRFLQIFIFLLVILARLIHMCRQTFPLHCVLDKHQTVSFRQ